MHETEPTPLLDRQFVEQCRRSPDRIALRQGDHAVTYTELAARSARAGAALRARGISDGAIVGLHLERSVDWVAATLAILSTHAAVLPLPPSYPAGRLRQILAQACPKAVIDSRATPIDPTLYRQSLNLNTLCTEGELGLAAVEAQANDAADRPAFVLSSSGSTGIPKLITRTHRSFFHRLTWTWERQPFATDDVGCHKAHTTTTHGIYELFEPLLCGAQVVIAADEQVRDLERFWALVRSRGVTRLLVVPSAMQASLDLPSFQPPPLRLVVLMGEPLPAGLAQRIAAAFPVQTGLYSIYGSTEASSTMVCDLRIPVPPGGELPLGKSISPDVGIHVLDASLNPVTLGHSGRLYISGTALFSGYMSQPEATAQVLIRHPHSGLLLYDTRDDVRCLPDGSVVYVGRSDDTVKIRGFRIELAEVERAISACPGVTQAAVVVNGGSSSHAVLVGFFTPSSVPESEVFRVLRQALPAYMIPAALYGLDAFPLTERSKLDRRQLLARLSSGDQDVLRQRELSSIEQRVAAIWERTLGHWRFDRNSSFFEVGGTSLTTAILVHRLRMEFGFDCADLPVQFAYRFPTVAKMAAFFDAPAALDTSDSTGRPSILVSLRSATDSSKPPLFCISSAGGTLGAYHKLASALRYGGEVIGVRDPYVSGERDPTESFDRWVQCYLDAILVRQFSGPYCIAAYSSAGAFGVELARRLRQRGSAVDLLVLVDPLGIEGDHWFRFGWWVLYSTHARPWIRRVTRLIGALRRPASRLLRKLCKPTRDQGFGLSADEFAQLSREMATSRARLLALAALMEMNTGLPLDLSDQHVPPEPADGTLRALQARIAAVMPEVDGPMIERIASQYVLQVQAQRAYRLSPYDGPTLLIEPTSQYCGLVEDQLRPWFSHLRVARLSLGPMDDRTRRITERFGPWTPHFLSMRDDQFALALAAVVDATLNSQLPAESGAQAAQYPHDSRA